MIINPLSGKSQIFIGEIKTQSPFGFKSEYSFNHLMNLCIETPQVDWISVHVSAIYGGCLDSIAYVKQFTLKPILAKAVNGSDKLIRQQIEIGAEYSLVVGRIPDLNLVSLNRCLLEVDPDFAREIRHDYPQHKLRFVWNSRDLRTGERKPMSELEDYLETNEWVCEASGIKSIDNVHPNVSAFIVGEHLVNFCKSL